MKKPNITFKEMLDLLKDDEDPVRSYTKWLLFDLWNNSVHYKVFMSSDPLPIPPDFGADEVPSFERVRNRLKIMTKLDPVIYQEPHDGVIEMVINNKAVDYHIVFHDIEALPRFEVTIKELGEYKIDSNDMS